MDFCRKQKDFFLRCTCAGIGIDWYWTILLNWTVGGRTNAPPWGKILNWRRILIQNREA